MSTDSFVCALFTIIVRFFPDACHIGVWGLVEDVPLYSCPLPLYEGPRRRYREGYGDDEGGARRQLRLNSAERLGSSLSHFLIHYLPLKEWPRPRLRCLGMYNVQGTEREAYAHEAILLSNLSPTFLSCPSSLSEKGY